jgi:hypothetical protein
VTPIVRDSLRCRSACALLACLGCCATLEAAEPLPEGIVVGRWVLAPWLASDYERDDNLLRLPDELQQEGDTETSTELSAGVEAALPFRNSALYLDYERGRRSYGESDFGREERQALGARAVFAFSTGDRLTLEDRMVEDFVQIREEFDEDVVFGAEERYQGEPFAAHRWSIEAERSEPGRQGYRVRIARRDRNYEGAGRPDLYNYRGFDNVFEYLQPLASGQSILFHYNSRRFNHYRVVDPVGVPFRREEADALQVGLTGKLLGGQRYLARLGYEQLRYPGEPSKARGLAGHLQGGFALGARTDLSLALSRRTLPSTLETYYIANTFRAALDRSWTRTLDFAAAIDVDQNEYGDPTGDDQSCSGDTRKDLALSVGADLEWAPHPRFGVRVGAHREQRNSNCASSDHDATEIRAGITLGWF